jgi:hypothetical protein
VAYQTAIVIDELGDGATNNITVQAAAGNIDGQATLVLQVNYVSATFMYNGTEWNCITLDNWGATQNLTVPGTLAVSGATAAFASRVTTTDGVASGTAKVVGGRAYTNTVPSTAVTTTTTETLFDTLYSIPANTIKAGTLIKVRFQGIATATNSTDTLTIKLYFGCTNANPPVGGTLLISMAATDVANNDVFQGEYELICRTAGASGTIVGVGTYKSVPAAEGTMTIKDDILASTALDTTAAQLLAVSATWSTNNSGNSCRLDVMKVEIY